MGLIFTIYLHGSFELFLQIGLPNIYCIFPLKNITT